MIGDVIGHDISAAAKMGQVRSMLRAFALAVPETPSESVRRLEPLTPSFVSVTYGAGGSTRERTHSTVKRMVEETGLKPAAHLTCVSASCGEVDEVIRAYRDVGMRVSYSYAVRDQNRLVYQADEEFVASLPKELQGPMQRWFDRFKMSLDDWDTVVDVNLRSAFLMSREAQRHMTTRGWGRIVNLSSIAALGTVGQANYSAAKAGLQGLTKTLALELVSETFHVVLQPA